MKRHSYLKVWINGCLCALLIAVTVTSGTCSGFAKEKDAYPLLYLQNQLTAILVNDNIVPPIAARDYVYPHLAAQYVLTQSSNGKKIFEGIAHFPVMKVSEKEQWSSSLASAYAFYEVSRKMVYTEKPLVDSFAVLLRWYKKNGMPASVQESSRRVGQQVAAKILEWASGDGFAETRNMNKYVLLGQPGKWQPTAPGYFGAIEPHWGRIRPLVITVTENARWIPVSFDTASASRYYGEAKNVYDIKLKLDNEQKEIASFWDCNPFALRPSGHVQSFVKKISPGGHWMHIAAIACRQRNTDIGTTSAVLASVAIALFDTFIQTWKLKFTYHTVRPETFIQQAGMDASWQPFIQAPPFPEFPSGHASISTASAVVLTRFFGGSFAYTDDTEVQFGLPARRFTSFAAAAKEASISRVYGGIHYPSSCSTGELIGAQTGNEIVQKCLSFIQ